MKEKIFDVFKTCNPSVISTVIDLQWHHYFNKKELEILEKIIKERYSKLKRQGKKLLLMPLQRLRTYKEI